MEHKTLSMRQFMLLLFVALLGPAVDLVPILSVWVAGSGGWLLPLGSIVPVLVALWLGSHACIGEKGVAQTIIYIMYMGWILLLLALTAKMCAARLSETYGVGPSFGFSVLVIALAVWMGLGKVEALARAGEIFYLALAVLLAGVVLLAAFQAEPDNLAVTGKELRRVPIGSAAVGGLLLNVYPTFLLAGRIKLDGGSRRRALGWTAAFCIAAALVTAAVIGCIGPRLTVGLSAPFTVMVQGLGIKGAFQRMEALVSALWVLSDLIMAGLLLHSWRTLAGGLHRGKWGRVTVPGVAAVSLICGWLLFPGADRARAFCVTVLPWTGLFFGLLCPLILWFFCARQKRKG